MSTLSVRLPDSLHEVVRSLARKEGISINQFISSAVAEKMSALMTEEYLVRRAGHGDRQAFLDAMARVSDSEPVEGDEIPEK